MALYKVVKAWDFNPENRVDTIHQIDGELHSSLSAHVVMISETNEITIQKPAELEVATPVEKGDATDLVGDELPMVEEAAKPASKK